MVSTVHSYSLSLPVSRTNEIARLQGLQEDVLDNSDTNYSIALVCFFITYIVFSVPGTLMAKQINPSWSIAAGATIWSIGATLQAAAFNRAGLFVCRLFVGVGEAFFVSFTSSSSPWCRSHHG